MSDSAQPDSPEVATAAPNDVGSPSIDLTEQAPLLDLVDGPIEAGADDLVVVETKTDDGLERAPLFGLDFVNADGLDPVVDALFDGPWSDGDIRPVVVTPNVDIVVQLDHAPGSIEEELYRRARFCLPDGQPIVAVSGLFGPRLGARLPGSSLFAQMWPEVVRRRTPVVVVASSTQVADELSRSHPGAGVLVAPYFDADDDEAVSSIVESLLAEADRVRPELVFVGIGHPKDARLVAALLDRWDERLGPVPVCLALGGSFLMYLGLKKRAPAWIQRIGMEWFYRFAQEPRRLFHRYFVRDLAFFGIVGRHWRASRTGGSSDAASTKPGPNR